uniref:Surface antigen protein n=1 Tax=Tetraselmis sp. GSL018 TaxID=582737 RepID=A0A061QU12_9CHLO|eukprot:CAMPEP_0177609366 /NCGR_PEP_ID=MMETSP0419_2-20121207/19040_1 /TAXON_ID=582737 /ORGANISM="Tetraselmis sp., Strain GSL018" /LENGTH=272 /DNA_ID=CAMNT_0019104265 /DNA_START=35 /DNA_END=853 /DNA_ORIENTATION=+
MIQSFAHAFLVLVFWGLIVNSGTEARRLKQDEQSTDQDIRSVAEALASGDFSSILNWNVTERPSPCDWQGILCSANGTVSGIDLSETTGLLRGKQLPPQWGQVASLLYIVTDDQGFTGTLPEAWSTLRNLRRIEIDEGALSGTLPPHWSSLSSLAYLALEDHRLGGSLPPEWSALRSLRYLDLDGNMLTGTLPASWSTLTALRELDMDSNFLTGGLPESWRNLSSLEELDLCRNSLRGEIPQEWSDLKDTVSEVCVDPAVTGLPARYLPFES